jgi:hypothetical protein
MKENEKEFPNVMEFSSNWITWGPHSFSKKIHSWFFSARNGFILQPYFIWKYEHDMNNDKNLFIALDGIGYRYSESRYKYLEPFENGHKVYKNIIREINILRRYLKSRKNMIPEEIINNGFKCRK